MELGAGGGGEIEEGDSERPGELAKEKGETARDAAKWAMPSKGSSDTERDRESER